MTEKPVPQPGAGRHPSREGRRVMVAFVHEATHRAVKKQAEAEGTTVALLVQEGVARVLTDRQKPLPGTLRKELENFHRPVPTTTPKPKGHEPG